MQHGGQRLAVARGVDDEESIGIRGGEREARGYNDRPSYGDRPQRDPRPFSERGPREGGFRGGDRDSRHSYNDRASFGDRPQREGGFRGGDRSEGGFRDRPSFDKRPGGPKRFDRRG